MTQERFRYIANKLREIEKLGTKLKDLSTDIRTFLEVQLEEDRTEEKVIKQLIDEADEP